MNEKPLAALRQGALYHRYREHQPRYRGWYVMCISNPNRRAVESREVALLCWLIREQWQPDRLWLYSLGAGWGIADIATWRDMQCFDSMDSIAYYLDARQGKQ